MKYNYPIKPDQSKEITLLMTKPDQSKEITLLMTREKQKLFFKEK